MRNYGMEKIKVVEIPKKVIIENEKITDTDQSFGKF